MNVNVMAVAMVVAASTAPHLRPLPPPLPQHLHLRRAPEYVTANVQKNATVPGSYPATMKLPCLGRRVLYKENVPKTIGFDPDWDARISGDLEIFR